MMRLPEGVVWPTYSDNAYVMPGDRVEGIGGPFMVETIEFYSQTLNLMGASDHLHLDYGERIERPAGPSNNCKGAGVSRAVNIVWPRYLDGGLVKLEDQVFFPDTGASKNVACISFGRSFAPEVFTYGETYISGSGAHRFLRPEAAGDGALLDRWEKLQTEAKELVGRSQGSGVRRIKDECGQRSAADDKDCWECVARDAFRSAEDQAEVSSE